MGVRNVMVAAMVMLVAAQALMLAAVRAQDCAVTVVENCNGGGKMEDMNKCCVALRQLYQTQRSCLCSTVIEAGMDQALLVGVLRTCGAIDSTNASPCSTAVTTAGSPPPPQAFSPPSLNNVQSPPTTFEQASPTFDSTRRTNGGRKNNFVGMTSLMAMVFFWWLTVAQ